MKIGELKRLKLCTLPTPLVEATRLSHELGGPRIFIKRDDLTGLAMGGNKTRPFEFIMADIQAKNTKVIIAAGYEQSNLVCNLIAAARRIGIEVILFLAKGTRNFQGNLLLYKILGAEIKFTDVEVKDLPILYKRMDLLAKELQKKGKKTYVMHYESFSPLGIASYFFLASEICKQLEEIKVMPQYLFHTSGSGSTQAGLMVGAKYFNAPFKVVGVMPNHRYTVAERVQMITRLANETANFLGIGIDFIPDEVNYFGEYAGEKASAPTKKGIEAIKLLAQTEGIFLDPIYSSKSMACLIDQIRKGEIYREDTVIYYHSGGLAQLFVYNQELSS